MSKYPIYRQVYDLYSCFLIKIIHFQVLTHSFTIGPILVEMLYVMYFFLII
nr:MAG TPA: hypothetical protein [Caudoviricetes sp.]